jgi:hypothetical protein
MDDQARARVTVIPQALEYELDVVQKAGQIRQDNVIELLIAQIDFFGGHVVERQTGVVGLRNPDHFSGDVNPHAHRRLDCRENVPRPAAHFQNSGLRLAVKAGQPLNVRVVASVSPAPGTQQWSIMIEKLAPTAQIFGHVRGRPGASDGDGPSPVPGLLFGGDCVPRHFVDTIVTDVLV